MVSNDSDHVSPRRTCLEKKKDSVRAVVRDIKKPGLTPRTMAEQLRQLRQQHFVRR